MGTVTIALTRKTLPCKVKGHVLKLPSHSLPLNAPIIGHKETKLWISWHAKHILKSLNCSFFLKISLYLVFRPIHSSSVQIPKSHPATRFHRPPKPLLDSPPGRSDRHHWGFCPESGSELKLHACRTETGSRRRLASPNFATSKWSQLSSSPDAFTLVSEGLISGLIDWSFCRCLSSSLGTGPLTSTCRSFMFMSFFVCFIYFFYIWRFSFFNIQFFIYRNSMSKWIFLRKR